MSILRDAGFFGGGFVLSWLTKPYLLKAWNGTATWNAERRAKKAKTTEAVVEVVDEKGVVGSAKDLGNAIKTFFVSKTAKGDGTSIVEVHVDDGEVVKMTSQELADLLDAKEAAETARDDLPVLK